MHHFLTLRLLPFAEQHRWNGILYGVFKQEAQAFGSTIEKLANTFARANQADGYLNAGIVFYFVKQHGRAVFTGGALTGAAGTNVAVYAGELGNRINFHIGGHQFAGQGF